MGSRTRVTGTVSKHLLVQILRRHDLACSASTPSPACLTFLHGGHLLAGHIELQRGATSWRGQVQVSGFVDTQETDGDSEALPWAPDHGLHCSCHHCSKTSVTDEESGG